MNNSESNTPMIDRFLERYRKTSSNSADRALALVLERNKEAIEPLFQEKDPCWLHKAFRQTEVCDRPTDDMLIWHLIHASRDFWGELEFFWNNTLDKTFERRNGALLADMTAQRDQLLAAIEALTYEQDGRYFTGIHGDTDVTELVAAAVAAVKGGAA